MWEKNYTPWQATDDNAIWRMRIASWMLKTTKAISGYVILAAFPQQHWIYVPA